MREIRSHVEPTKTADEVQQVEASVWVAPQSGPAIVTLLSSGGATSG
jgi:hypothetical protein